MLEAVGVVEKRAGAIAFVVKRFSAENRQLPLTTVQALMCALGTAEAGKFKWPEVMHESRAYVGKQLDAGQNLNVDGIVIDIPLGREFRSGSTTLNCFVETPPTGSYPIGNGSPNILAWQ